jgi:aromatic ring-opening dioxygenase LigB subunit
MPLALAALLPHSPLLVPEIGRANCDFLKKTADAYNSIGEKLQAAAVNTIIIISPHGAPAADSFVLNIAPEMEIDLKDFGFIPPRTVFSGDAILADQIQNALRPDFPLQLISETLLDSGSAIPLYLLRPFIPQAKVLVIAPATGLTLQEQFNFGVKLRETIEASDKKIAIIASGDLSHRLKKKSPGGYSPKGAKFDNKLIECLASPSSAAENIINLDQKLIEAAGECGLKPLSLLLGLISPQAWQADIMAYQTDFGIGYLSVNFTWYGK